jgi:hypothetical protein
MEGLNMTEVQKVLVGVVGGLVAIFIGIAGLTNPPLLSTGNTLSVALIIGGLGILGVGPISTAYTAARVADLNKP